MDSPMFSRRFPGSSEHQDTDKLTEVYPVRIPEGTKKMLDALSPELKHMLNNEIRIAMAWVIHESKFDPSLYLKTD